MTASDQYKHIKLRTRHLKSVSWQSSSCSLSTSRINWSCSWRLWSSQRLLMKPLKPSSTRMLQWICQLRKKTEAWRHHQDHFPGHHRLPLSHHPQITPSVPCPQEAPMTPLPWILTQVCCQNQLQWLVHHQLPHHHHQQWSCPRPSSSSHLSQNQWSRATCAPTAAPPTPPPGGRTAVVGVYAMPVVCISVFTGVPGLQSGVAMVLWWGGPGGAMWRKSVETKRSHSSHEDSSQDTEDWRQDKMRWEEQWQQIRGADQK